LNDVYKSLNQPFFSNKHVHIFWLISIPDNGYWLISIPDNGY
jgi:hypothetical protein